MCERLAKGRYSILTKQLLSYFIEHFLMKKALREMQTLHAGCSKVEPNNFGVPQTPFLGVWDGQNLISWRWSLPLPINQVH